LNVIVAKSYLYLENTYKKLNVRECAKSLDQQYHISSFGLDLAAKSFMKGKEVFAVVRRQDPTGVSLAFEKCFVGVLSYTSLVVERFAHRCVRYKTKENGENPVADKIVYSKLKDSHRLVSVSNDYDGSN